MWKWLKSCYPCTFLPRRNKFDYVQTWRECVLDQVALMEERALELQVVSEREFDAMVFAEFQDAEKQNVRFARNRVFG